MKADDMQASTTSRMTASNRNSRSGIGIAMVALGAVFAFFGTVSTPANALQDTQNIPLSNDEADVLKDCPDTAGDYWHFVITPNNDTFSFVTIYLNLDGTTMTFTGADIIRNGDQPDNVFVAVPAGYTLDSIVISGSTADITPTSGAPKFVLSHFCDGSSTPTTTTTIAPTTTTIAPTTTTIAATTTTIAATTTTIAATTTTDGGSGSATTTTTTPIDSTTTTTDGGSGSATTTTIGAATTTTERVGQAGPTTTTTPGPTTTISQQLAVTTTVAAELPRTGAEQRLLLVGGAALMGLGLLMLQLGRRPKTF